MQRSHTGQAYALIMGEVARRQFDFEEQRAKRRPHAVRHAQAGDPGSLDARLRILPQAAPTFGSETRCDAVDAT